MNLKSLGVCTAIVVALGAAACTKSSPARPTDGSATGTTASVTDASTGITITTPTLASPADGAKFKYTDQPLTLTINNAAATGGTITYSFQVASDSGFGTVVFSKDGVAAGSGTTSLQIGQLAGNANYYWRARAVTNSTTGAYSKSRSFNVGPQVVLQAPTLVSPANGANANGSAPSFTVQNAARTGPAGPITYLFSLSTTSAFSSVLASNVVSEGSGGQTTATISTPLTANATYYWRVQALDTQNSIQGPFSTIWSFKYVPFDMHQALIFDNPPDVADWPQTANITSVNFTGDAFLVDFDKRDSPDRWPDQPFGEGSLEYTLGLCGNRNGTWMCSAVVQFWYGRDLAASTPPSYVGQNWFYDVRWGGLQGYQPQDGETVGLWVGAGNLRGQSFTRATCPGLCERSNVAFVQWHNSDQALFTFSLPNGRALSLTRRR